MDNDITCIPHHNVVTEIQFILRSTRVMKNLLTAIDGQACQSLALSWKCHIQYATPLVAIAIS